MRARRRGRSRPPSRRLPPTGHTREPGGNVDYHLYSYANVLLMYAEALNEAGRTADAVALLIRAQRGDRRARRATRWAALLAICGPAVAVAQVAPAAGRPNVLWIIAEDMSADLAVYGTQAVRTPNLDRLAARGMRFTRAFATGPTCSPSRSALMTGVYQTTLGAQHHRLPDSLAPRLPARVQLLTDRMRAAGYFTANVRAVSDSVAGTGKTDWNFRYGGTPFDSDRWGDLKARQPFFAQVNFTESHRPYNAPRRTDPARVALPPYYPDHPVTRRDWADYLDDVAELDRKVGVVLDRLDRDGLAENTVVVFFSDQGREMLRGKQWAYDAGLRVPLIVFWPERVAAPRHYRAGRVDDRLVSLLDVNATTLAIAGVGKGTTLTHGRVIFGAHADPPRRYVFGAADRSGDVLIHSRTVRTARYRYIRNRHPLDPAIASSWYRKEVDPGYHLVLKMGAEGRLTPAQQMLVDPRPPEELYDLSADPHETANLVGVDDHRAALGELRTALDRWTRETNDQGQFPDPPRIRRYFELYSEQGARARSAAIAGMRARVFQADSAYLNVVRDARLLTPAAPTTSPSGRP